MAYSKAQIDRIGNLLVYITSKLGPTPKTKLLKLIYIIEEESVKQSGTPFTELAYTFFPLGPVCTFVNNQIDKKREPITHFVSIQGTGNSITISPNAIFDDGEFSDFDFQIIDEVIKKFSGLSSAKLIEYTHREGSVWKQINDQFEGKMPPQNNREINLLKVEGISEEVRKISEKGKAFIDYLTTNE